MGPVRPLPGEPGHFHLGRSYILNQTVVSLIATALPKTLVLVGLSTLLAVVVAIPLGVYQVVRRNKPEDYIITGFTFVLTRCRLSSSARC